MRTGEKTEKAAEQIGAWTPLRHPVFRMLWIAILFVNIASWMQDVGAGWLMTSLAPTPVMVSLVQAATSTPFFLLAIPAGAMADIVDRRRYLIGTQVWMVACAGTLGILTLSGMTGSVLLLLFTFFLGVGIAMMMPAWGAIIPELVPREELQSAVALNSIAINIARSVGPAIAGIIVASAGSGAVFMANACLYSIVLFLIARWKRNVPQSALPSEHLFSAVKTGLRFARHSQALRAVMVRGCCFFIFASASWALMPLIVRQELKSGPGTYGLLLACIGIGAITGATLMPRLIRRVTRDTIIRGASALYGIAMLALAASDIVAAACAAMLVIGLSWMMTASALMTAAQISLPGWVRARGLAFFWIVFTGGMAGGSVIWGQVAGLLTISWALAIAAICLFIGIAVSWRFYVGLQDKADLTPLSPDWAGPVPRHIGMEEGPIMVIIEYRIRPEDTDAFIEAMTRLRDIRQRNGATLWHLYNDMTRPGIMVESFTIETMLEMLRQRERMTVADREVRDRARAFHRDGAPPKVTRLLSAIGHKRIFD
ncbi:MFS transporter [Oxalobacter paraformigenes]|uniref:Major facilitator superfamily (MFS) profile domain-containing protein n=1 Tax=Oxalobacter paraformigenes TaxID=556268 RepID=C3X2R8_9BURK|nr:MFS transporter [Oxalobacter paraformigenes]EEO27504.1 hypothetical protein OFAG_00657 [Oxalobacter paraformigenes]